MHKIVFNILFFILFIISFNGCQSALNVFNKTGSQYEKGLQHTKVKNLIYENETKAIINVTYLNSMDNKKWDNEYQNFLIGIYISKDNKNKSKTYLSNAKYTLTENDRYFVKNTIISKEHSLYKNIPIKNPWAKYYIVSFIKGSDKILVLKYSHAKFGKVNFSFEAE